MSLEYLYLAFIVLLARTAMGSRERAIKLPRFATWTAVQLFALAAMRIVPALGIPVAAIIVVNLGAFLLERNESTRDLVRFVAAVLLLAVLSFIGPPESSAVRFAAWVIRLSHAVAGASLLLAGLDGRSVASALSILSGALFVSAEINNLTRYILLRLKVAPTSATGEQDPGGRELRRGKMIGIVERLLIYYFVLTANLAAIGFVLAAKGFTRFRELDNRDFAEYVLIGTLLSAGGAILVGIATELAIRSLS